jgi:hypothetical protein
MYTAITLVWRVSGVYIELSVIHGTFDRGTTLLQKGHAVRRPACCPQAGNRSITIERRVRARRISSGALQIRTGDDRDDR